MILFVESYLREKWDRLFPERQMPGQFHFMLLGTHNARSKVLMAFADTEASPFVVGKVARDETGIRGLQRERENLASIPSAGLGESVQFPQLVGFDQVEADTVLLMTALSGDTLQLRWNQLKKNDEIIPRLAADAKAGTRLLVTCQKAFTSGSGEHDLSQLLTDLTEAFTGIHEQSESEVTFCGALAKKLARLTAREIPKVWSHGDYWAGNLLEDSDRGYGLVDWEFATEHGIPYWDLFFFLTTLAVYSPWGSRGNDPVSGIKTLLASDSPLLPGIEWCLNYYSTEMDYPKEWIQPLYELFLLGMCSFRWREDGKKHCLDEEWREILKIEDNILRSWGAQRG